MSWNISAWSIRNPIPSILLFVVLVALGLFSFTQLPITRFPNIDIPLITVNVTQSGAAPSELETQVTKRVEDAVAGVTGVKRVISLDLRRPVADDHRVPARGQFGSRAQRRQGRGRQDPGGPAAHHRRADHPAPRHRGPADPHLCGERARNVAGADLLVRRRCGRRARCRACAASARCSASAASTARSGCSSTPTGCSRWASPPAR